MICKSRVRFLQGLARREHAPQRGRAPAAALWLLGFFFLPTFAWNAEPSQAEKADQGIRMNVGFSTAKPGDPIDIPLTLSGIGESQIGTLVSEITFPKDALSFVRAEQGLAAEASGAEIQATLKEVGDDANLSEIEVTIAGKRPLKLGILAYLKFRVSTDAKKGLLPLKVKSYKATTAAGQSLQIAKGKDGEVTVFDKNETIPVIGCFFFAH